MSENISVKENKKTIGALFDRIASHYDLLNHLLTLNIDKLWRRKTVKEITKSDIQNQESNIHLLDVATGTCDLTIEILKQHNNFIITGIDLSEKMLEIGKAKTDKLGLQNKIILMQQNVEQLTFEDNRFAFVTCGFGVRNFNNLDNGLKEMYRVLQPKGKIIILEFAYPKNLFVRFLYNIYFTYILPLVGKIISKDNTAYKYLMKSVKDFPKGEEFLAHLRNCGFENLSYKNLTLGIAAIYTGEKI
ncbi:MAG: bifunctional demethylmenaquinone methyltransferase/2-methoxy-6-polyprenyl-1,4-benzoquinol methylase UbiE [Bacteroidales bacterium]|nr:bifunctional demethylmenaquinone methyltransferase/2-methoxy-6-polyprenyl-1,4-benzoquinol methylase UbiE [Bacteroidales bacterium]